MSFQQQEEKPNNVVEVKQSLPFITVVNELNRNRNRASNVGKNNSQELDVAVPHKVLHISSFNPTVKGKNIVEYITVHTGLQKEKYSYFALVKKDADMSRLRKISFILVVNSNSYSLMRDPTLWPTHVRVQQLNRNICELSVVQDKTLEVPVKCLNAVNTRPYNTFAMSQNIYYHNNGVIRSTC